MSKKLAKKTITIMSRQQAEKLRDEMLAEFRSAEKSLIAAAVKLDKFIRGHGWKALGHESLTAWREKEFNFTEFYNLRNVTKLLSAGVPAEKLEQMPISNMAALVHDVPEKKWNDPKLIKEAIESPIKTFKERVESRSKDAGTASEEVLRRGFVASVSIVEKYDLALRVAEQVDGVARMDEKLDAILSAYLDAQSDAPGRSKLQMYEAIRAEIATSPKEIEEVTVDAEI